MEDNMNMQERMIDKKTFRIAVFAVAAAAVLVLAAYLFGTGLRADTPASLAPSPLGSSLTDARQARAAAPSAFSASSLDARGARTIVSAARAASLAALAKSRSDFYADQNNSAMAARLASLRAISNYRPGFLAGADTSAAAADPYQYEWMGFTSPDSVRAKSSVAEYSDRARGLWFDIPAAGTRARQSESSASSVGASSAADLYQNAWMGSTSPESVGAKSSVTTGSASDQYQWIKPEGIQPSGAVEAAVDQYQWIKPEGIQAPGAK
jgi:hypothetical protein